MIVDPPLGVLSVLGGEGLLRAILVPIRRI
jgi:hypothetical protein